MCDEFQFVLIVYLGMCVCVHVYACVYVRHVHVGTCMCIIFIKINTLAIHALFVKSSFCDNLGILDS